MSGTCPGPECDRPPVTRGLCDGHYAQIRRGKPLTRLRHYSPRRQPDSQCPTCADALRLISQGERIEVAAARIGLRPASLALHLHRHDQPVPAGGWAK